MVRNPAERDPSMRLLPYRSLRLCLDTTPQPLLFEKQYSALDNELVAFDIPPHASMGGPHLRLTSSSPFTPRLAIVLLIGGEETTLDLGRYCRNYSDNSRRFH